MNQPDRRLKPTRTVVLRAADGIENTRRTIDAIDTLILDLVRARVRCAQWIGTQKSVLGRPAIDTNREREVLSNACAHAGESVPLSTTISLMREMIHLSRIVQCTPRVGFLGPTGTHSEAAARSAFSNYAQYVSFETFEDLCAQLGREVEFAVIPAFNRILGPLAEGLDALRRMPVGVRIERITTIPVRQHLAEDFDQRSDDETDFLILTWCGDLDLKPRIDAAPCE